MSLIAVNSLVYCLFALWSVSMAEECVPRKIVPYRGDMIHFREEGVGNYSSMLLQEHLGLLFLGARGAIYAMDVNDISAPKAKVDWQVTEQEQKECESKGKLPEECQNYILILHSVGDGRMYVCGTKAFTPSCDYMTYSDGKLLLSGNVEEGKGKCPFNPARHACSVMVDGVMYAATYTNFLGSHYAMLRTSGTTLSTENTISWLNDPSFVYMDMIPESVDSVDGDDDKVYLFFNEKAVEFDFYHKIRVSRVARVCKGDLGGHLSLQKKWTSYLKARLDCSVLEPSLPYVVRDVFLLRDADWRNSIFYAVFTPQSGQKDYSAICAYNLSTIKKVFSQGKYKDPHLVGSSDFKWVMYKGEVPSPRPGACIDNAARNMGVTESLNLPDKTLHFVRDRPLMHDVVQPLLGKPLLVKRGPLFTCIVVDKVAALNGQTYPVMFIGTENGCIQKALNYDGEMFITEERQLFRDPVRIKVLRLSSSKGQLYAASDLGVVQVPLSHCTRYTSCQDCVLARDPYCAWDQQTSQCRDHLRLQSKGSMIQSLLEADVTLCPKAGDMIHFREEGVGNYSSMLLQEHLGLLFLGARGAIYAMDVNDISAPKAKVDWQVTEQEQKECESKGKLPEECQNYILILHSVGDGRMYVCGTKAFTPSCDYMTYSDGKLLLSGNVEEGKGKCPFNPARHACSVMVDGVMYAATYTNFLGSHYAMLRTSGTTLSTENTVSWLNDPSFVYMDMIPESVDSVDGDDDKVYLFFNEKAVEFDFYHKIRVSRVARVCKGDLGGHLSLQKKWTSYLKARLDCSVLEPSLPYVVRDVFLLRDADWRNSIFYAVFTPQSGQKDYSAICAYNLSTIKKVFSQGKYKDPHLVGSSDFKWVMYKGEVPSPRPGACIDNAARNMGVTESLNLPDKTLHFVRDRPLMHDVVQPLLGKPLLVKRGPLFTCIVVDKVAALNGQTYPVMFIGTENGCIQKALNYDGEMFITEERQLFRDPVRIKVLRLSSSKGQLYAASDLGVVQVPLSHCTRYTSCQDCVLARDPYCAWDQQTSQCRDHLRLQSKGSMIQSLLEADVTLCPKAASIPLKSTFTGSAFKLACQTDCQLAGIYRYFTAVSRFSCLNQNITDTVGESFNPTTDDKGHYSCQSVERVKGSQYYNCRVAQYRLWLSTESKQGRLYGGTGHRLAGFIPALGGGIALCAVSAVHYYISLCSVQGIFVGNLHCIFCSGFQNIYLPCISINAF